MCRLCAALSPPLGYMIDRSEWYWDERPRRGLPSWEHYRQVCAELPEWTDFCCPIECEEVDLEAAQAAPEASPHRAPPRDRLFSPGTTSPNPPVRVHCVICDYLCL